MLHFARRGDRHRHESSEVRSRFPSGSLGYRRRDRHRGAQDLRPQVGRFTSPNRSRGFMKGYRKCPTFLPDPEPLEILHEAGSQTCMSEPSSEEPTRYQRAIPTPLTRRWRSRYGERTTGLPEPCFGPRRSDRHSLKPAPPRSNLRNDTFQCPTDPAPPHSTPNSARWPALDASATCKTPSPAPRSGFPPPPPPTPTRREMVTAPSPS
jgi:hypothetical protein